jgi:hypothetical protein
MSRRKQLTAAEQGPQGPLAVMAWPCYQCHLPGARAVINGLVACGTDQRVLCRGYIDAHGTDATWQLRMIKALWGFIIVTPPRGPQTRQEARR